MLRAHDDRLALFSELDQMEIWAGDGHHIDLVRPTARGIEHEITTLKRQDKQDLRCGAEKGQSTLMVYDTAIVDFQYAYDLKQSKSIYVLTAWRNNFAVLTIIPREIDHSYSANALVIRDETVYFTLPAFGGGSPPHAPTAMRFT